MYAIQDSKLTSALHELQMRMVQEKDLKDIVPKCFAAAQAAIGAIPIPKTSIILEAGSPFTAYCRLHELCAADATTSLAWLDPYLDATVFHRYLSSVRPQATITLVTCEPGNNSRDKQRWSEFLDISRLFAAERKAAFYRLIVQHSLHDRWVVFDQKRIYSLGGSAKDAASRDYFTIAAVADVPANVQAIDAHIASGLEWFGPKTPQHR